MCTTCGCGHGSARIEGQGLRRSGAPGPGPRRLVQVSRNLLEKNDACARSNREAFAARGIFVLNLVSSPGSGKTSLLTALIPRLKEKLPIAVIEGDQQTVLDAERIRATGVPALQINTGKGCHLDAHGVGHAAEHLGLPADSVLVIENVGNLVCPAAFDLGETHKVVILSVTEGEDKPLKYPDMFAAADLLLLNKVDLLPHLAFDAEACLGHARRINPKLEVIRTSATTGEGLDAWAAWILRGAGAARRGREAGQGAKKAGTPCPA
jgi:hydrogenase nickel incorporation protein HypB